MTRLALNLLIAAANVVKPAPAAPPNEVESIVKAAAQLEKSDGCEAAYAKYQEAGGKLLQMRDHARAAQLSGIVTNKLDKLQACYSACQPNEKQRELFGTAKDATSAKTSKKEPALNCFSWRSWRSW